ncbi:MAG: FecR family protein [Marinifilaceae bacterium]
MKAEIPYDQIAKSLREEASQEEKEQLQQWIESSEVNRELYKRILKTWKFQHAFAFHPHKEKAWSKLESQMALSAEDRGRRVFLRRALQLAAVLVLAIGLWTLFQPTGIFFGEKMLAFRTAADQQQSILLADGTEVFLNRGSELRYPEAFKGEKRRVLLKGEAFFKVARNPEKPFLIETKHTRTRVLGTSFNLRAYEGEGVETLSVKTGKVAFSSRKGKEKVILTPNQVGQLTLKEQELSKHELKNPNYMAWRTKVFVFSDQSLREIVASLSHAYGVSIEIRNPNLDKERLTTSFKQLELGDVLEILSQTLGFEYSSAGKKKIIIK